MVTESSYHKPHLTSPDLISADLISHEATPFTVKAKVKFSYTHYGALGLELIPVYRQSDKGGF